VQSIARVAHCSVSDKRNNLGTGFRLSPIILRCSAMHIAHYTWPGTSCYETRNKTYSLHSEKKCAVSWNIKNLLFFCDLYRFVTDIKMH